jgi:hypothetical protein
MNNKKTPPHGVVSILTAVMIIVLLGFAGLAIDVGYLLLQKTRMQSVADASALACVIEPDTCSGGGLNLFPAVNPYGATVSLANPVDCPDPALQDRCAQATGSAVWDTFFLRLFGQPQARISATAVAGYRSGIVHHHHNGFSRKRYEYR